MHYPKPSPDEARACSHHAERVDSGRLGHLDATPALARVLGAISRCALTCGASQSTRGQTSADE